MYGGVVACPALTESATAAKTTARMGALENMITQQKNVVYEGM